MFQTFQEINSFYSEDDSAPTWRTGRSYRAMWAVINDRSFGNDRTAWRKNFLDYFNIIFQLLLEQKDPITRVQKLNSKLYSGKHYFSQDQYSNLPNRYTKNRNYDPGYAKIVMNYLGQAVEQHVSDQSGYEPNLTVMPTKDQEQERVAARANKMVIDHYWDQWDLKVAFQTFHRRKKVHGETFAFLLWDPDLGDLNPKYKEYKKMMEDLGKADEPMPLVDQFGVPVLGEDNQQLFISKPVKCGDLRFEQEYSCRVLHPCPESYLWRDVPYVIRLHWMDLDEAKARWPKEADKIKPDYMYKWGVGPSGRSITEKVLVRYLYHKPTTFLEKGYYCATTMSAFLEESDYPFSHGELPCIRGTDIDLDFEITGMSFMQNLVTLNQAMNNSASMILKNQAQFANPKYVAPRGAKVRYTDLGNENGIYEYSGPQAPEIMARNSTPQDTWQTLSLMRDEFKTLSQIYATSRGEGIDGITANVALRMIDEQERKLHKPAIDKHGQNCKMLGTMTLSVLGDYRDPTDGMLIKVLGRNNERYLKYFDVINLKGSCEVRLERSSGLPESPAAKTQTVLDLKQSFPQLWPDDEVLSVLDINQPERLIESATVARQTAEGEVEDILAGVPNVPVPSPLDDILPKYRVYLKAVQSRNFRDTDPRIQQRMIVQIVTAEYIIMKKIRMNPMFGQLIAQSEPNFPTMFPQAQNMMQFQLASATPPMLPGEENADPLAGIDPNTAMNAQMGSGQMNTPEPDSLPQNIAPEQGALP